MTLTIEAAPRFGSPARVELTAYSVPSVLDDVTVWRVHPDGSRWRVLLEQGGDVMAGTWAGIDWHAPSARTVRWQIECAGQTSPLSNPVTLPSESCWLLHPWDPTLSVRLDGVKEWDVDTEWEDRSVQVDVLGRAEPIDRTVNVRGSMSTGLTIKSATVANRNALLKLFKAGGPVLLSTPWDDTDLGWRWVRPGTVTMSRFYGPRRATEARRFSFPIKHIAAPDVDVRALWTLRAIADWYAQPGGLAEIAGTYPTLRHLQLNHRPGGA